MRCSLRPWLQGMPRGLSPLSPVVAAFLPCLRVRSDLHASCLGRAGPSKAVFVLQAVTMTVPLLSSVLSYFTESSCLRAAGHVKAFAVLLPISERRAMKARRCGLLVAVRASPVLLEHAVWFAVSVLMIQASA